MNDTAIDAEVAEARRRVTACVRACDGIANPETVVPWMARTIRNFVRTYANAPLHLGTLMDAETIVALLDDGATTTGRGG